MFELFVVGTFWFWALVVAEVLLLFVFVNYENGIGATISLIAFGALLQWFGGVDILGYMVSHPIAVLAMVAAYLLAGVTWSVIRWWLYCRDRVSKYNGLKQEFLVENGEPAGTKVVPAHLRSLWAEWLKDHRDSNGKSLGDTPRVRDNKNRILGWMTFWVISVIWFLINDFVKGIFKEIYQYVAGFLQRIADNMFAHVRDDLQGVPGTDTTRKDRR